MEAAPSNPTHNIISTAPSAAISMNSSVATHRNPLRVDWPTVDGPLGLSEQESVDHARRFFKFGFLLLPWLWAVNCLYFWPVIRRPSSYYHPDLRRYVVRSAIGFTVFAVILSSWALTFSIGGEGLFGHAWDKLVMYNVAEKYGLTGWI
ncbi:probable gamma-secretase subunit PEN-2 [Solanum stenotomum]|uniref:probable gamma-secretase subunit PEN-2 n=1 Tax=Solanum stenotomum TaxID=172797 RepID=UPI0020D0EC98|nr:probable gamma-secretase subunit PEN-2 [Solanum stenotomum]